MNYVGIDIHKRYSVLAAHGEEGRKLKEARIEGNSAGDYSRFFRSLEGPSRAVLEACWNWGLTVILCNLRREHDDISFTTIKAIQSSGL